MRSCHRYASDGLVFSLSLHMIREYLNDRYSHHRWLAWVSGIVLLIFCITIGITGYWLVWDERAQLIAFKTTELLNDIPIFIEPLSRSFLTDETLNKMLFFLLHLIHLGLPVAMIILIGLHIMRSSRPILMPSKIITIAVLSTLFIASIILPATSAQPANLNRLPVDTPFDWCFLFIYTAMSLLPKPVFWLITTGGTVILFIMPWIKGNRPPAAKVILENCTGCEQCNKDCPYDAIYLQPCYDRLPYKMKAVVIPERCASCGICVGACDFNAINLPDMTEIQVKEEIVKLLSTIQLTNRPKILLLICKRCISLDLLHNIERSSLKGMPNVKAITLPCIGMTQSSMIDRGLKYGADGVFICSCIIGDCHYRKGNIWLQARIGNERPPLLNRGIDRWRIREFQVSPINATLMRIAEEIHLFERDIKTYNSKPRNPTLTCLRLPVPLARQTGVMHRQEGGAFCGLQGKSGYKNFQDIKSTDEKRNEKGILKKTMTFSIIPILFFIFLSTRITYSFYNKNSSLLKFTFKYSSRHRVDCRELTEKEMDTILKHMRKTNSPFPKIRMDCSKRERLPIYVELDFDNKNILSRKYYPTGLRRDGATFVYEEIPILPGSHWLKVRITDFKVGNPLNYNLEKKVEFKPGYINVIDLSNTF